MFIGFEAQSQDFDLHSRLKSVDFQIELGAFATEPLADLNIQLVFTGPLNSAGLLAFHFGVGGDLWSDLSSSDAGFVFTTALSYGGRPPGRGRSGFSTLCR